MGEWEKIKMGAFLFERKEKFEPDANAILGLKKIEKITFADGKIRLGNYKLTKTKQLIVEPGDFIFSGLNIEKGAVSINETNERLAVSANYSTCKVDYSVINQEFFLWYLRSPEFKQLLIDNLKKDYGFTRPKHLLPLVIKLPDIEYQKRIAEYFNNIETKDTELKQEITHQQSLLKKLRQQILQEAIEGKLTADWRAQQNSPPAKGESREAGRGLTSSQGRVLQSREGVKSKHIHNLPHLKTFRKSLRKNLTPAEAKLWSLIKGKQLQGRRFRRQHSVANYILDFYCPAEKLAIELDGEGHNNPQVAKQDEDRDIFLEHTGIKVLRFENKVVFRHPEGVLAMIEQEFNPSAPSAHLPLAGEEFESAAMLLERIRVEKERLIEAGEMKKQKPLLPVSQEFNPSAPSAHLPLAGEEFESAAMLLERIRVEKERLIEAGDIKKQKPLPPISQEFNPSAPSAHLPLAGEEFESAAMLLERIRVEKERLIEAGEIKRQKPLPPISQDEKPFELPEGWEWCRLGEVILSYEAGKSFQCIDRKVVNKEWGVLKTSAITSSVFLEEEHKFYQQQGPDDVSKRVRNGDLIFCRASGSKGLAGKCCLVNMISKNLLLSDKTPRLITSNFISNKLIFFHNESEKTRVYYAQLNTGKSTSMNNITKDQLLNKPFPLPPLSEQQAIVAKVEKLLTLCDQLEAQITENQAHARALMQAVLKEAFSQ